MVSNAPSEDRFVGTVLTAVNRLDRVTFAYAELRRPSDLLDAIGQAARCHAALLAEANRIGVGHLAASIDPKGPT